MNESVTGIFETNKLGTDILEKKKMEENIGI